MGRKFLRGEANIAMTNDVTNEKFEFRELKCNSYPVSYSHPSESQTLYPFAVHA